MSCLDNRPCGTCNRVTNCNSTCESWAQWFKFEWTRIRLMYKGLRK